MKRIQQALEQAERDRSALRPGTPGQPVAPQVTENSQPAAATVGSSTEVRFQRTRIVDVSDDVLEQHRLVAALPDHEFTDVYRVLRTRVLQSLNANQWNSLAITSPATGSGKSLTAINLAISLAREVNRTVLLADFDLRNPCIHEYFGYEPEAGIGDYLFDDVPLEKILFSPSIDRLVVLPGRESIHNSSEMLRSPKMLALVSEIKERYQDRLVIFDLPPILAVDDALAFSPYVDAMLLIAENGGTQRDDMTKALEMLRGTPLIGTVLNKSPISASGYKKK
jgi:protein-tyrosine kinase